MAPEHRRLHRYRTMTIEEICSLPVKLVADEPSHLYLWCPNGISKSPFAKLNLDRMLGTAVTIRNWNTVTKLAELA